MLYLMRKQDESIIINNNIELKVIEIKGKTVKLGFQFPQGASVLRKELFDKIIAENQAASSQLLDASILDSSSNLLLGKARIASKQAGNSTEDGKNSEDSE